MGHARALLGLPSSGYRRRNTPNVRRRRGIQYAKLSEWCKKPLREREVSQPSATPEKPLDPNVAAAVRDLESVLGTRVRIVEKNDQRGRIEIEYYSQDDLNRIYEILTGVGGAGGRS